MDLKLAGKNAIVTGGTRGIGRAIVEVLLDEGVNVAFCARNQDRVEQTLNEFAHKKAKAIGAAIDVSQHDRFKDWIVASAKTLGGLDILVLNAAGMVASNSEEDWTRNINIDLLGAVYATEVAKPLLAEAAKKSGDAAIIYISSISAAEAYGKSSYGPIKAALSHFSKGVAKEDASLGIRANVISPGPVYFPGGHWEQVEQTNPGFFKEMMDQIPLNRMAKPEEIAYAVAFLASPLSAFANGSNLVIDGGYTRKVSF